ncbi:hypothetical protein [Labilibaculum euxinus]
MPPTDNLYKFIFISGILIYLYSLTFLATQFVNNRDLEFKYNSDYISTCDLIEKDSIRVEMLSYKFEQFTMLNLKGMNLRTLDSLALNTNQQEIFQEYLILNSQLSSNKKLLVFIKNRMSEPIVYKNASNFIFVVLFILGSILIPIGFMLWYNKYHKPNMKLLEKKMLDESIVIEDDSRTKISFIVCWVAFAFLLVIPIFFLDYVIDKSREEKKKEQVVKSNSSTKIENATVIIYRK